MRYLLSLLVLVFAAGCCATCRQAAAMPGLYLTFDGKAGHGVVSLTDGAPRPFYEFRGGNFREQVSVSKIREDNSSVEVAFLYCITLDEGGASTAPAEQFTFSKINPTKVTLLTGVDVTGHWRKQ